VDANVDPEKIRHRRNFTTMRNTSRSEGQEELSIYHCQL
jgi:hypothetical protein